MNYRLEKKDKFSVTGKIINLSTKDGENFRAIPKFWRDCNSNGTTNKLCKAFNTGIMLGICMDMDMDKESLNYMIAVVGEGHNDDFESIELPAAEWAIFTSVGPMPNAIQNVWKEIYSDFFQTSDYVHAPSPDFELYLEGDPMGEDYISEIWIPVIRK
jgi:AraC family transcriptional regulator